MLCKINDREFWHHFGVTLTLREGVSFAIFEKGFRFRAIFHNDLRRVILRHEAMKMGDELLDVSTQNK